MERQKPSEYKEKSEKKLEELRKELAELRERKKQKELLEEKAEEIVSAIQEKEESQLKEDYIEEPEPAGVNLSDLDDIEARLEKLDQFLGKQFEATDQKTYDQHTEYIESELQVLEKEIVTEKGIIEKEISPYEKVLENYPWLEEKRFEFMYSIPDKKKNKTDFESWLKEWSKVLFDYAKYAILHILYVRKLNSEKPFSKFINREESIKEIAEELIAQKLAKWLSKKKDQLRVYWKTLESWADELYDWAYDLGKLDPILIYEIREAGKEFSTLPKEDLEAVFKVLGKSNRGTTIKLDDGQISFKIKLE